MKVKFEIENTEEQISPIEQARIWFKFARRNGLRVEAVCNEMLAVLMELQTMNIRSKYIKRGIERKALEGMEI